MMISRWTATLATVFFAGASAAQVETYFGAQIIREDGFANFDSLHYPDSLVDYTEGGLYLTVNNVEWDQFGLNGTPAYYPNGGCFEAVIVRRADGAPFEALEFQAWNGWATDPSWVWAEASLGGELQGLFDIDVPGPSQGFPVLGFKGRFDELRIYANYSAGQRDAHNPSEYQAIAMDNMRFGSVGANDCYPDFNGDGTLDLFDFLAYVNSFNAGAEEADCDGDNELTLFDFLCYTNAFNAGC